MSRRVEPAPAAAGAAPCPSCATEADPSDLFCEACGTALRPPELPRVPPACPACGEVETDTDGFCASCGLRRGTGVPVDPAGNRAEIDLGSLAGVSDRGLVHQTNEDGMALAREPCPIVVVCDGVSTAPRSGPAARAAAEAAAESLAADLLPPELGLAWLVDPADALVTAVAAAQQAVLDRPVAARESGPACTLVAAVVVGDTLTVGWLGDSRVYLFGADGPVRLTEDDTLAAQRVRAGLIAPEAAESGPGAHTITRWLGRDNGGDVRPHLASTPLTGAGRVVVCSDGLWNYSSPPAELAAHVEALPADAAPIQVARRLTDVALRAGGHDNITVVVVDIPGRL